MHMLVSFLASSYAPVLVICLFLSHLALALIYVTLYFVYPCKVPYVLLRTKQLINI